MTWKKNFVVLMLCLIICGVNGPIYRNTHANTGLDTNQPPSVDFTYTPTNPTDIDVVQFHDNSVDTDGWIVAWIWYFGDGDSSLLQNPDHKYSDNGIFQISLTVIDNNGTINTTTKTITILNVPPVADCGDDRYVNQNVLHLTASQSYDIDGEIINYTWVINETQLYYGKNINYTFHEGTYSVFLTVTDNDGENASDMCILVVDTQPPVTSVKIIGEKGANNWYMENVTVGLDTKDETSGIKHIKYRLDNSIWYRYNKPFNISLQGKHTLSYYSMDNAHNIEKEKVVNINIDKTDPYGKIIQPKENYVYLFNRIKWHIPENTVIIGPVLIKIEARDKEAGIERVEFYADNTLRYLTKESPYTWTWDETSLGRVKLMTVIYDKSGRQSSDELDIVAFRL